MGEAERLPTVPSLGVAVVGLGVGEAHAEAYVQSGCCRLRWVYDLDAARMQQVVARLRQGTPASSLQDILADPQVDLVSIASYDDAHSAQVLAALSAGKHVFVEKPLCRSLRELQAIKRAWQEHGYRLLRCNLVLRAAPLYRWLKQAIAAGELGEIYAFDGDYLYGRLHKLTQGWRRDVRAYSVMQGGGIHLVDLMLWLTGQRPQRVSAVGNRLCTRHTAFRYLDYVAATFCFPSGLVGRITANFGCVHRHQHVVRVFGTRATFVYDDAGARLHRGRDAAPATCPVPLAPLPASKGALIPEVVASLLAGADTRAQTQDDFATMCACLAADEALASGEPETISYLA
ncbi:MAG: hypothetical protein KatS3mg131_1313 [Candidatus Tectimicrobiota bacterium]|nr:MAG: hypothetical protein KatS3mg131_1313 [Candidatus Tectomicrobia bacterium]